MTNVSYEATIKDIDASLEASQLGYIDLYLLHSAIGGPEKRRGCWRACVDAKKAGKVKSIGVSNYGIAHLQEMVDQGVELPVVNQVRRITDGAAFVGSNRAVTRWTCTRS